MMLQCKPLGVHMDLAMRSYSNGTLDLPMLSRAYGTPVDQANHLDNALLLI